MKLHSPEFEKALKRSVRKAVRSDAELRRAYRRAKGRRRPTCVVWFTRLLFSWMLATGVSTFYRLTNHPETALAAITLWTLAATAFLSSLFSANANRDSSIRALRLLPVSDFTIFQFRRDRLLVFYLTVVLDLLAGLGTLAFLLALPKAAWIAGLLVVALTWAFSVALAMFVSARFPWLRTSWITLSVAIFFFAWVVGRRDFGPQMLAAFDRSAPALNLIVPTGWPLAFSHWLTSDWSWTPLVLLIPIAFVFCDYRACERVICARFAYQEPVPLAPPPEQVPGQRNVPLVWRNPKRVDLADMPHSSSIGVTAIAEGIASREFLALPGWDRDSAQRLYWNWLTPREKRVAAFMFPNPPAIVRPWKRIVLHTPLAIAAVLLTHRYLPTFEAFVLILAPVISVAGMLLQTCAAGATFRTVQNFGIRIAPISIYPARFIGLPCYFPIAPEKSILKIYRLP